MEAFHLPEPDISVMESAQELSILEEETSYDTDSLKHFVQQQYQKLNEGQKKVFNEVMHSVNKDDGKNGKIFCLNAGGGTGKNNYKQLAS